MLKASDLDGDEVATLVGTVASPRECQLACCDNPACGFYVYTMFPAVCFLKANSTSLVVSSIHHSGVLMSRLK